MAKRGAINAGRVVNAAPDEEDFDILMKAAMLNVGDKAEHPLTITVGFPLSTYNAYKNAAGNYLSRRHFMMEYDSATFNVNGGMRKSSFEVDLYDVIPEIVGGIIGLKKTSPVEVPSNFIAISFGFGTVEGGLASNEGLVHRTCFSSHGLRYVIGNLARELNTKHYLDMKNEHQLDDAFMKDYIFTNRKRIDIKELKKNLLKQYYREVVSPLLRQYFTDADMELCEKIYLMGGGAHYRDLTECVEEEFQGFLPVEVVPQPDTIVSLGYLYNSLRVSDNNPQRCIGIDLGNANTSVSVFETPAQ